MDILFENVMFFIFVLLGFVIFGYEATVIGMLFLVYTRLGK